MATIGVAFKPGVNSPDLLLQICDWASAHGHPVIAEAGVVLPPGVELVKFSAAELVFKSDWVISIGGDGTLIWLARYARDDGPLFIGVHSGTFGFLTEIRSSELVEVLNRLHEGEMHAEERDAVSVRLVRNGGGVFSCTALNDAVVQKGSQGRILDIDLSIDGEGVTRMRADGIIVATPTGSTAYSLSAGGPIVHPSQKVMVITPICAHSLTNRPLIVGMASRVEVRVPHYEGEIFLNVDGQGMVQLQSDDTVVVEGASHRIRFIRSPSLSYYDILRTKLNWGLHNI